MTNEHDAASNTSDAPKMIDARPEPQKGPDGDRPHKPRGVRRFGYAAAALALVFAGAGVGATAVSFSRPHAQMAPLAPVAISAMPDDSIVTIKGTVAEIYGDKFILQDDSGKALVETGPAGFGGKLVTASEPLTVQGRFDDGFLHAAFIVRANGKTEAIGPMGPGPHEHGKRGPGPDDGPRGPDAPDGPGGPRGPL